MPSENYKCAISSLLNLLSFVRFANPNPSLKPLLRRLLRERRTREMFRSVVRTAAGNLKLNRRSLIPNDAVSHFPPAATTLIPSLDHIHRSFSSSKSTKSTITKTKKSEGKKSKSKGGEASSAGGAEDGEFGGSAGDDLESGRAKRLADDEKIPSLDVGPNGRPLFTPRDVTLSKLSHKDIGSYFKFEYISIYISSLSLLCIVVCVYVCVMCG